jgi:hypothetical protein
VHRWHDAESGYNHQQSTRPNTLTIGLGGSPAGLAAWIPENLSAGLTPAGTSRPSSGASDLLDWITAYRVSGAIGTSFAPYASRERPSGATTAPTAFTFPADLVNVPLDFAAQIVMLTASAAVGAAPRAEDTSTHGNAPTTTSQGFAQPLNVAGHKRGASHDDRKRLAGPESRTPFNSNGSHSATAQRRRKSTDGR